MAFPELIDNTSKSGKTDENEANVCHVMSAFKRLRVNDNNVRMVGNSKPNESVNSETVHTSHNNVNHRRRTHHTNPNRDKFAKSKRSHSTVNEQSFHFGAKSKYAIQDFSELNPILFKQNQSIGVNNKSDINSFNSYRMEKSDSILCATTTMKLNNSCEEKSCAQQALCDNTLSHSRADISGDITDASVDELSAYFADNLYLPRKMSFMAEMMYT